MRFINEYKGVELVIDEKIIEEMTYQSIKHYPNEYGGFLVGCYSSERTLLTITDHIPPTDYKSHPYLFERGTKGIEKKLHKLFNNRSKEYYVGEWHTHPNGSTNFSITDLNAMTNIANNASVKIKNPTLLIISINKKGMNGFDFYLYDTKKLYIYERTS